MSVRTFTDVQDLIDSGLECPYDLEDEAREKGGKGDVCELHYALREGVEVWTLVLPEEARASQWQDGERVDGAWVPERRALRPDEGEGAEFFDLEGRRLPEGLADEEEAGWGEGRQAADPSSL